MKRGLTIIPLVLVPSLSSFLSLTTACDPEYSLCVVATSCRDDLPIAAGEHIRIREYDLDGTTSSGGKLCKNELNFPSPFEIEADAPGFVPRTEGPFQLGKPGATDFQATVCLDPL